jgi:plastocyanin
MATPTLLPGRRAADKEEMRRFSRLVAAAVLAAALSPDGLSPRPAAATVPPGAGPCPASGHIASVDFAFVPSLKSVALGRRVAWDFCTTTGHNVVDATPMGLFDSGSGVMGDPPFEFTFNAAGQYPYVCTFHPGMTGRIKVKMDAVPHNGSPATSFALTWASTSAPKGYAYDVQIRRPASDRWRSWKRAVSPPGHSFHPDAGPGPYRFRSRLRSVGIGHADWSKTATIHVH